MVGSVARLERFKEFMVGHVLMELCSYCSFQGLAEERKVADWSVVSKVIRVQTRLLDRLCYTKCNFKLGHSPAS